MLDVAGAEFRSCDRLPRRELLRVGGLALGGLTLASLLRRRAGAADPASVRQTAVIQIFCGGGPSHLDTYDLKPNAPAEIRGEFREIPTSVPGVRLGEHLPLQARVMDRLAIVRSVSHGNSSHLPSSHLVLTGHEPSGDLADNANPSCGSIASRLRGPNAGGLPAYVAVPRRTSFGGPAYLGGAYGPFATVNDPNAESFNVPDLRPLPALSAARLDHRGGLLASLDRLRRDLDQAGGMASFDRYHREALEIITGPRAAAAFDIGREDPRVRDSYGRTPIGQNCLLARRLVEAGVTYVTCLSGGGWDTHANNFGELKAVTLPRYDRAIAALVADLHQRGLADRVLVLAMGEFGRTPRINRDAGRDHWPGAMSVLFAGGGLKVGGVVGATDAQGAYPTTRPYSPRSVLATVYHVLGIDPGHVFRDASDRPVPVLPDGEPIAELL
jgi:hypothetical protein